MLAGAAEAEPGDQAVLAAGAVDAELLAQLWPGGGEGRWGHPATGRSLGTFLL